MFFCLPTSYMKLCALQTAWNKNEKSFERCARNMWTECLYFVGCVAKICKARPGGSNHKDVFQIVIAQFNKMQILSGKESWGDTYKPPNISIQVKPCARCQSRESSLVRHMSPHFWLRPRTILLQIKFLVIIYSSVWIMYWRAAQISKIVPRIGRWADASCTKHHSMSLKTFIYLVLIRSWSSTRNRFSLKTMLDNITQQYMTLVILNFFYSLFGSASIWNLAWIAQNVCSVSFILSSCI